MSGRSAPATTTPAARDELAFYCPWSLPWVTMLAGDWRLGGPWRDGDLGHHAEYSVLLVREEGP